MGPGLNRDSPGYPSPHRNGFDVVSGPSDMVSRTGSFPPLPGFAPPVGIINGFILHTNVDRSRIYSPTSMEDTAFQALLHRRTMNPKTRFPEIH
jgi:hypothetical protein